MELLLGKVYDTFKAMTIARPTYLVESLTLSINEVWGYQMYIYRILKKKKKKKNFVSLLMFPFIFCKLYYFISVNCIMLSKFHMFGYFNLQWEKIKRCVTTYD